MPLLRDIPISEIQALTYEQVSQVYHDLMGGNAASQKAAAYIMSVWEAKQQQDRQTRSDQQTEEARQDQRRANDPVRQVAIGTASGAAGAGAVEGGRAIVNGIRGAISPAPSTAAQSGARYSAEVAAQRAAAQGATPAQIGQAYSEAYEAALKSPSSVSTAQTVPTATQQAPQLATTGAQSATTANNINLGTTGSTNLSEAAPWSWSAGSDSAYGAAGSAPSTPNVVSSGYVGGESQGAASTGASGVSEYLPYLGYLTSAYNTYNAAKPMWSGASGEEKGAAANRTAGTIGGGVIGGLVGSLGGPAGTAAGAALGSTAGGILAGYDPIGRQVATSLFTGKDHDQVVRDSIRDALKERGIVDSNYNLRLADRQTYNIAGDGSEQIYNVGWGTPEYDALVNAEYSNDADKQQKISDFIDENYGSTIQKLNPLVEAIIGTKDKKPYDDLMGILVNATHSGGDVNANIDAIYRDFGGVNGTADEALLKPYYVPFGKQQQYYSSLFGG